MEDQLILKVYPYSESALKSGPIWRLISHDSTFKYNIALVKRFDLLLLLDSILKTLEYI